MIVLERDREWIFDLILDTIVFPRAFDESGIDEDDECWGWSGQRIAPNTAVIRIFTEDGKKTNYRSARRIFYELYFNETLEPLENVFMTCSSSGICMNPAHFEKRLKTRRTPEVTDLSGMFVPADEDPASAPEFLPRVPPKRSKPRRAHPRVRGTACPNGHPYVDGSYRINYAGNRQCRQCGRDASRRYRAKQLARTGIPPSGKAAKIARWRRRSVEYLESL